MRSILFALIFLFSGNLFAHSAFELKKAEYSGFPNTLKGRDFFTIQASKKASTKIMSSEPLARDTETCRAHIAKVICLVDPVDDIDKPIEKPIERVCLEGGQNYTAIFERLYDNYPPAFQKMFCSLHHLYIEKKFFGTAYAGTIEDENKKIIGAVMGIRQSVLDENLNLQTWASWKEQQSFGGVKDSYTILPHLPQIETTSQTNANDFLYFVIAHEFGHIFDFANDINAFKTCKEYPDEGDPECEMAEGTWGAISWITESTAKPANEFPNRKGLCFYSCGQTPLSPELAPQIYADLHKTEFISTYATTQPWDDFADSLGYYLSAQNLKTRYILDTRQGQQYDIIEKLYSPVFAKKYQYIEQFLQRSDIVYP